jgi:tRNA1Val (adenine37-N6)-methyltransferase
MNNVFRFKQFEVEHEWSAQKVGTDGVLLGSWTPINESCKNILDIGTGSGLIALMLAQRTFEYITIDAIDIDELAYKQATKNFFNSSWSKKINAYHTSLQNFQPEKKYDLIVCNPPFFSNSLKPENISRTKARHDNSLLLNDLIFHAKRMLKAESCFSVIFPFERKDELINKAFENQLLPIVICNVKGNEKTSPKRVMILFQHTTKEIICKEEELIIEISRNSYTDTYKALTKDFYLNF